MLSRLVPCVRLLLMTFKRRHLIYILLTVSAVLVLFFAAGCKPGPTTIIGSVSFLNTATMNQTLPPVLPITVHPGPVGDDVAYARLVDNSGAGATIWESAAIDAGTALLPYVGTTTSNDGVYIDSFVINLTDAQITGATMPLRLEVFLYDDPVAVGFPALDPGLDALRYSYFNANGEGNPQWYSLIYIGVGEVKTSNLFATLPIVP